MKIAILGGSFNPIHNGHLHLADEVRCAFGYERIFFIPAFFPPHKTLASDVCAAGRAEMVSRAIAGNPFFEFDDFEIKRGGISYTIDTVTYLEKKYAAQLSSPIGVIIGDDLLNGFDTWRNADELAQRVTLIVAKRMRAQEILPVHMFEYPHVCLDNTLLPISSTDIRNRIAEKKAWRYLVPPAVYEYIINGKIYGYGQND